MKSAIFLATRGSSKWHFCKNNRNDYGVSSQCPEINSVEYTQEDEQNERIRRSATDLNKRDGLNTGLPVAFRNRETFPLKAFRLYFSADIREEKCFVLSKTVNTIFKNSHVKKYLVRKLYWLWVRARAICVSVYV